MVSSLRPPRRSSTPPPERRSSAPATLPSSPSSPPAPLESSLHPPGGVSRSSIFPHVSRLSSLRPGSLRPGSWRPQQDLAHEPIVHPAADGVFFGSWKNVFVSVWETQGTLIGIDRMFGAIAAMPRIAEKRSDIHVIAEGARLPEPKVRDHFIDLIRSSSDALAGVAVVVGGSGFCASALRSFVTGLHWLAPRSFDFRLERSVDEVASWLPAVHERLSGVRLDPNRLRHLLSEWTAPRLRPQR